jgi:hypothetical protein
VLIEAEACRVRFDFRYGWCRMELTVGPHSGVYAATSIADSFGALADAVAAVAAGSLVASTLWGDEPGGVFVDLATSGPRHIGLVLHQLGEPGWLTPQNPPWTPVRGDVLLDARLPAGVAFREFHTGFRQVEDHVSENGKIEGWGHPFPTAALTVMEQVLNPEM